VILALHDAETNDRTVHLAQRLAVPAVEHAATNEGTSTSRSGGKRTLRNVAYEYSRWRSYDLQLDAMPKAAFSGALSLAVRRKIDGTHPEVPQPANETDVCREQSGKPRAGLKTRNPNAKAT
jgi:hypothetical protein